MSPQVTFCTSLLSRHNYPFEKGALLTLMRQTKPKEDLRETAMARRKPTLNQLYWRFLNPGISLWLTALTLMLGQVIYVEVMTSVTARFTNTPVTLPAEFIALPFILMITGVIASAWRYYKDHHCCEIYNEIDL